jgi:hypothetical protein
MKTFGRKMVVLPIGIVLLLVGACGEGQKVGSEKLLEFKEQQGASRLGERTPEPNQTPGSLTVGERTPAPTPRPTTAPNYFEISLIADSPFYKDMTNNKVGAKFTVRVGTTIRVTNNDQTPERSDGRSFTEASSGIFNSGLLKVGQQWTWTFRQPANYQVKDIGKLKFANAVVQVVP